MEDVFGILGQAILSAIGAAGVLGLTMWLLFDGPLGAYILALLGSAIGAGPA